MADGRKDNGEKDGKDHIDQFPSLASKSSNGIATDEAKVTIHSAPPESRSSALSNLDPNRADDLTRIRGITKDVAQKLYRIGISHFDQIADWSSTDVRSLSAALKLGQSIYRQAWIEQAARLALRRHPTELTSGVEKNALSAVTPAPAPRANSKRTVAALVASAAAAIRARALLNQPHVDTAKQQDQSTHDAAKNQAILPLTPPREISRQELDSRITLSFSHIANAVGLSAARFPDRADEIEPDTKVQPEERRETLLDLDPPIPTGAPISNATPQPTVDAAPPSEPPPVADVEPATKDFEEIAVDSAPVAAPSVDFVPPSPDDLRLIQDMPDEVADRLNELDVKYFSEIAAFDAEDVAVLSDDCNLGDRIYRECWLEQAAMLASGMLTKAARYRTSGQGLNLAPYPTATLQQDPAAFASLKPPLVSPVCNEAGGAPPAIPSSDDPAIETIVELPAENLPASPDPPAAQIMPPPIPVAAEAHSAPHSFEPAAESDTTDDGSDLETTGYEEADVMIRPRSHSPLDMSATSLPRPDAANDTGSSPPEPGSLSSKLSEDRNTINGNEDDQAGYLSNVEEAAVEIIAARTSNQPSAIPAKHGALEESPQAGHQIEQRSVNRFLKALRGR